ncbi:hypothetical protein ACFSSC_09815 [Corynebacterium mendelii]|uniref:Uncharacterized protein n=1 Tax=Corynebacterium mendelii TaxID=2765362 RepID=A0A939IY86_9CORY|nr:hypothetical protein [Corynebacterium mendelii]MBN9645275.1 hypothetical protein [Corynebacterium mendelii]
MSVVVNPSNGDGLEYSKKEYNTKLIMSVLGNLGVSLVFGPARIIAVFVPDRQRTNQTAAPPRTTFGFPQFLGEVDKSLLTPIKPAANLLGFTR